MYALARVVVSYFFFCVSLHGLQCCEGQAPAWGYPLSVSWPFELLQSATLGKCAQLREEGDQLCSVCSQKCHVSN